MTHSGNPGQFTPVVCGVCGSVRNLAHSVEKVGRLTLAGTAAVPRPCPVCENTAKLDAILRQITVAQAEMAAMEAQVPQEATG